MSQLASFFTKIGFQVDKSSVRQFENQLDHLKAKVDSLGASLKKAVGKVQPQVQKASSRALDVVGLKRKQQIKDEISSRQELIKMGDFYRKQEALQLKESIKKQTGMAKMHSQALRDNIAFDKRKQRTMLSEAYLLNKEFSLRERNRRAEIANAERVGAIKLKNNLRLEALRIKENIRSNLPSRSSRVGGEMDAALPWKQALGAGAAMSGAKQLYDVAQFTTSRLPQFEFLTGSAEEAAKQIAFVDGEVERLSLNLIGANTQYKNLLAAGGDALGVENTQRLFTGFSELSTILGLSADSQNRGLKAFSQMASKGQVMAEELKGQLAEALPGAVGMFADALTDGDTGKLFKQMEGGKVGIDELIKVIEHMSTLTDKELLDKMMNTPAKKFQAMANSWTRMLEELNRAGVLDVMVKTFELLADAIKIVADAVYTISPALKGLADILKDVMVILKPLLPLIYAFGAVLVGGALVGGIKALPATAGKATLAIHALMLGIRKFLIWPIVAAASLALLIDLIETLQGKDTLFSRSAKGDGATSWLSGWIIMFAETLSLIGKLTVSLLQLDGEYANLSLFNFADKLKEYFPKWHEFWSSLGLGIVDALSFGFTWVEMFLENMITRIKDVVQLLWFAKNMQFGKAIEAYESIKSNNLIPTESQVATRQFGDMFTKPTTSSVQNKIDVTVNIPENLKRPEEVGRYVADAMEQFYSTKITQAASNYVMATGN